MSCYVLQAYIEKTLALRRGNEDDHLLISLRKPYKKVCSQILSDWVKKSYQIVVLISVFGAQNTRHASISRSSAGRKPGSGTKGHRLV